MDGPDADEFDLDVHGERLLEQVGLLPPRLVRECEHLVRKRHLLVVARREQADLVFASAHKRAHWA